MKTLTPYGAAWKALEDDPEFKQAIEHYCDNGKVIRVTVIPGSTIKPSTNPYRISPTDSGSHYILVGSEWLLWHKRWHPFIAKAILMS